MGSVIALAAAAPKKLSSTFLSTPMARGGGRIVGGTEASVGEFPHQIALLRGGVGGSLMCGGSLVAADRVITAGHCCDGQSASRLGVRVGSHNLYEALLFSSFLFASLLISSLLFSSVFLFSSLLFSSL